MNVNAYLTFRKDYLKIRERIIKRLETVQLKFDKNGNGEKGLFTMKLRDCKQLHIPNGALITGDTLNFISIKTLALFLSTDLDIKKKVLANNSEILVYAIDPQLDEYYDKDGKKKFEIDFVISFNQNNDENRKIHDLMEKLNSMTDEELLNMK